MFITILILLRLSPVMYCLTAFHNQWNVVKKASRTPVILMEFNAVSLLCYRIILLSQTPPAELSYTWNYWTKTKDGSCDETGKDTKCAQCFGQQCSLHFCSQSCLVPLSF